MRSLARASGPARITAPARQRPAAIGARNDASAGVLDCLGWAMDWNLNFTLEAALLQEMVKEGKTGGRRARVSAGPVTASARRFCRSPPREGAAGGARSE